MAESVQTVECPATPERVDQCPETPDRLLNMKSPDSSTSSDNECTINLRTRNTNSPPPNCAICLGRCKNKCFTDSCLHQFCFKCLLEWSKVKAECPLCKQPFNSIIHNVKSIDQFEEYLVAQPQQAPPSIPSVPLPMPPLAHHPPAVGMDHGLYSRQLDMYLGQYTRFRRSGYSTTVQVHPADNDALQQIFLHRSLLVERLRHEYADGVIPPNMLGELWRRYIYDRRLYAMPVVDITGRYRECSARFFRDNPAQMHRIMSWIDRDARCLLRDSEHHAAFVLEVIRDILPVFNITSPEFRRRLQTYFGLRTAHFIHELLNFARSPFDMIGYDREVRYSPYYEEVVISSSSSSSGFSDTEDVIHVRGGGGASGTRRPGRTEVTIETRSNNSTFIITGTFNGSGASGTGSGGIRGDNSVPSSSLPAEIIEVGRTPFENLLQPQILGESQVIQIDRNIVLSSSTSDECEFVCEQKPPHLRTPEQVSLNSESDSDCVFVGESHRTPTIEPAAHTKRKRKPPKGVFISSLSAPSSTTSSSSESDNETVNKREAKSKSKKKKKNKSQESKRPKDTTTTSSPDNIKTESSQTPAAPSEQPPSIISDCNNSNANDEYNNGASTSSGLPSNGNITNNGSRSSSTRSQVAVKKYYARPVRQATGKRVRNGKSIYEESSCDTDESSTEDKAFERTFKSEKISNESDDSLSDATEKLMRKNRKRKHERVRRRQSDRRHSTVTATSKKKKSKKSSARKKLSSSLVKSLKRRKLSMSATSKSAQQQQQQQKQHRRRQKARKLSSTKQRSSSVSSAATSSSSSSTTTTSSSSSSTSSGSESANNEGWSSSSSE